MINSYTLGNVNQCIIFLKDFLVRIVLRAGKKNIKKKTHDTVLLFWPYCKLLTNFHAQLLSFGEQLYGHKQIITDNKYHSFFLVCKIIQHLKAF